MRVVTAQWLFLVLASVALGWSQDAPPPPPPPTVSTAASTQGSASLSGQVVNGKTGEGLRRVQVTLRQVGNMGQGFATATGDDGRFAFPGIPPGRYMIHAERNGFVVATSNTSSTATGMPAGTSLYDLVSGADRSDAVIRLVPQGVVAGRVLDEEGEPVSGVFVQLMRAHYMGGKRQMIGATSANTNDRGEYRLYGLVRGHYYVSAMRRTSAEMLDSAPSVRGGGASAPTREGYVPVYYPGTTDASGAVALDVVPGSELTGVDLRLVKARTVQVSGRIEGLTPDMRNVAVNLLPRDVLGGMAGRNFHATNFSVETGSFVLNGVSPGNYTLAADLMVSEPTMRRMARVPVLVGNTDIDGLVLTLGPGLDPTGSVKVDGQTPDGFTAKGMVVNFLARDGYAAPGEAVSVQADGTFAGFTLVPSVYSVMLRPMPADAYIKSVRMGNADVLATGMDLTGGAAGPVEITLSFAAAQVEGVVNQSDQPFPGATVALVPADPQWRSVTARYRTATTDAQGHFLLRGVAPGDYKVFAWDKIEAGAYESPEFLQRYESSGVSVTVQENGHENKTLTLLQGDGGE